MDSWDDDEFEVPNVLPPQQDNAPASWSDEEEEEEEEVPQDDIKKANAPLKPKQLKKLKQQEAEARRREEHLKAQRRAMEQAELENSLTDAERKLREKAIIEQADMENTLDAFGATVIEGVKGSDEEREEEIGKDAPVEELEAAVASMKINTLKDYEQLSELLFAKMEGGNVKYYLEFITNMLRKGESIMAVEDVQELTAVLNVIKNNKVQAAKPKAKKKKGKKQGYAVVERATFDEYDDMGYGNDMDDFM